MTGYISVLNSPENVLFPFPSIYLLLYLIYIELYTLYGAFSTNWISSSAFAYKATAN